MRRTAPLAGLALLAACDLSLAAQETQGPAVSPELPAFDAAAFARPAANPWYPLAAGPVRKYRGRTPDGEIERIEISVQGPGPVILGVPTTAVLDRVWEEDLIVEETLDYFAADDRGNVWYFGEDVTNYRYDDEGRLLGTDDESAWRAGVDGAVPGISFPAAPAPGPAVFQEHAPADEAMDYGQVIATGLTLQGPAGTFGDVVQVYESSTAEPTSRGFKYYAPGLGMIREEELTSDGAAVEMTVDLVP